MKIDDHASWETPRDETIQRYTERRLSLERADSGALESLRAQNENHIRAFGNLLDLLARKGLLSAPEITGIVGYYENPEARFA